MQLQSLSRKLETVEALWFLDEIREEDLSSFAWELLEAGMESPALLRLAGLIPAERTEARSIFSAALQEMGRAKLTTLEALRRFTRHVAHKLSMQEMAPKDAAQRIWDVVTATDYAGHEFDASIYAASE